jgi:hypothetical protein
MTSESTFLTVFISVGVISVAYLVVLHFLYERLAENHIATYNSLGSPMFFSNLGVSAGLKVLRFLILRRYRRMNDVVVVRLADTALGLLVISVLGSIALNIMFSLNGY